MLGAVNTGLASKGGAKQQGRSKPIDVLDPYVKASVGSSRARTKTVEDAGAEAVFGAQHDNKMRLAVRVREGEDDIEPELTLAVWDDDPGRDDFLGQVVVPLWGLVDEARYTQKMIEENRSIEEKKLKAFLKGAKKMQYEYMETTGAGVRAQRYGRRMSAPDINLLVPQATGARDDTAMSKEAEALAAESTTSPTKTATSVGQDMMPPHELVAGITKRFALQDAKGDPHQGFLEITLEWDPVGSTTEPGATIHESLPGAIIEESASAGMLMSPRTAERERDRRTSDEKCIGYVIVTIVRGSGLEANEDSELEEEAEILFYGSVGILVLYLLIGILFYCIFGKKDSEDGEGEVSWTVIDAIYFSVITFTTVGYGDLLPHDAGTRMFTAIFAFVGVSLIGFALGIVTSYLMEMVEEALKSSLSAAQESGVSAAEAHRRVADARIYGKKQSLAKTFAALLVVILIGAALFRLFEPDDGGEDWWTAIYCATITASSVGYGDFSFTTQPGRAVSIFYTIIAVMLCARVVGNIADIVVDIQSSKVYEKKLKKTVHAGDILAMDEDDDGEVDQLEFLKMYLVKLGKAEKGDIDEILAQFDVLDVDKSGTLTFQDLQTPATM